MEHGVLYKGRRKLQVLAYYTTSPAFVADREAGDGSVRCFVDYLLMDGKNRKKVLWREL